MTRLLLLSLFTGITALFGVSPSGSENFLTLYIDAPENHEVTIKHGDAPMGKQTDPDRWELNIPFKEKAPITAEVRYTGPKEDEPEWVSPSQPTRFLLFKDTGLPDFSKKHINWGSRKYRDYKKWILEVKIQKSIAPLSFDVIITKQLVPLSQAALSE